MDKAYDSREVEDKIYELWEKSGFFNPDNLKGEPYAIMMPPPNVTGILHLGHALENSLMDTMARYQRMRGKKVLLLPGTDHAAVATQAKVEKLLMEKGIKHPRQELGREKLIEEIREYAEKSKATILGQIRKLGTSCDWSRLAYTFDEQRSLAVNEVFIRMYNDGLIYRGYRAVNWSVKGQSTCSDDELEHVERSAKLYTFKYSKDFPISIATTRPETKLGDTAVAVNPKDPRYKKFVGQIFEVKNFGGAVDLKIKIIADPNVEKDFGTGALGVTPAHSLIDFEMYERQKAAGEPITLIKVIGEDGKMTSVAGSPYAGLTVEVAREKVVAWLEKSGLLEKVEDIAQSVGTSDRFKDAVEVIPMTQWWLDVNKPIPGRGKTLRQLMAEAVTTGLNGDSQQKVKITPERFKKPYLDRINNLRDWCLSRQIWWGHRIPVWYKKLAKPMEITYFVHGSSTDNVAKRASGHHDVGLSERGIEKSKEAAKQIKASDFDVIFSSDLKRAVQTAEIFFGQGKFKQDKRLREISYGKLNGEKVELVGPLKTKKINEPFSGGESYRDVEKRLNEFLQDLAVKHPGKKIAIVAHQAPQLALEVLTQNKTWEQAFKDDWRNIPNNWQPGWQYSLAGLVQVGVKSPGKEWIQDEDTLDTWFSSGLWTFSTLNWPTFAKATAGKPSKSKDWKNFHPTAWMQMGYEIIFLWLVRMVLMSTYALDQIPFKDVYIHGMLRDEKGEKFSKSKGDNIDPLEMIAKYGTDALRLSVLAGIMPGNDVRFYLEKIEGSRNMVNKLWNISRYILESANSNKIKIDPKALTLTDRWILSRMQETIERVTKFINSYEFSAAGEELRAFTWNELADWYLEISKTEKDKDAILFYLLENLLKLWHPYMPFVTEEIWSLWKQRGLLMVESWPKVEKKYLNKKVVQEFTVIQGIVTAIRNLRAENKIEPGKKVKAVVVAGAKVKFIQEQAEAIKFLARLGELEVLKSGKVDKAAVAVVGGMEVYLPLADLVDAGKEKEKIGQELAMTEKYLASLKNKLANQEFVSKAPAQVVAAEKEKLAAAEEKMGKLKKQLDSLK